MISNSKTFCINPWATLRISQNGDVGVCSYSKNVGNLNIVPLHELHQGTTINEIKGCIAKGEWHEACVYCKDAEEVGGRSDRLHANQVVDQSLIDSIDADPSKNYLSYLSINQSNLCNLSCTYCGPTHSTEWGKKLSIPINVTRIDIDSTIDYLTQHKDSLVGIMFGGGEPLLQKHTHLFLERLGTPDKQLKISLTTNLSVPLENNPVWKTIQQLGDAAVFCDWLVSFESIGDKFEYVRNGASWEVFKKNIKLLKDAGQVVTAHPAFGIYCAFDLVEYCDFCVENDLPIFWCDIFSPYQLDVRYLPSALRELVVSNIDAVLTKYKDHKLVPTATLIKYKDMAINGVSFVAPEANDKERADNILKFNQSIENTLKKTVWFADLWPAINQQLLTIAHD